MFKNGKIKYAYLLLAFVQVMLSLVAFIGFRMRPLETLFCNNGDGLKNYFTLNSFVQPQSNGANLFFYKVMNYPFGEYVYCLDNTPFFAILLKFFCLHIADVSAYTIPIFNVFIVLNIVLAALIGFKVLRLLQLPDTWAFLFMTFMTWCNMQLVRIPRGHFNLSLSFLIVLSILFLLFYFRSSTIRKQWLNAIALVLIIFVGFLLHGYYLAILGVFVASTLFFSGFYLKGKMPFLKRVFMALLIPGVAAGLSMVLLYATDGFMQERAMGQDSYDWMWQKVRFWSLFTAPKFYDFKFPISNVSAACDPENSGYIGNFAAYLLLIFSVLAIVSTDYRQQIKTHCVWALKQYYTGPIFFAGIVMVLANFGDNYYLSENPGGVMIVNFLNPLFWVHMVTDGVEQFRSLGRYVWPFYWTLNIFLLVVVHRLFNQGNFPSNAKKILLAIFAIICVIEIKDNIDEMQGVAKNENFLSERGAKRFEKVNLNPSDYQAFVALPYFNVGCDRGDLTIDDNDESSRAAYQFHQYSRLPMMNVKLARTLTSQAKELFDFLAWDSCSTDLKNRFNQKPILIMSDTLALQNETGYFVPNADRQSMRDAHFAIARLPERKGLIPVARQEQFVFYAWYPFQ